MDWRKIWELPLKVDEYGSSYAWSHNDTMALTMDIVDSTFFKNIREEILLKEIVDAINDTKPYTRGGIWTADGCDIFCNGEYVMCVRGWGELTSPNCFSLSPKEACETQDDFVAHILSKLNVEK